MKHVLRSRQRGVTLVVGLIMLVLITMMVTTAYKLNTSNLKSVGNMQARNESVAAANNAIEQFVSIDFPSGFLAVPPGRQIEYDINNDGVVDYRVAVAQPVCVEATEVSTDVTEACSGLRGGALAGCPKANHSTLWDMEARVVDAVSGAVVTVRQGVRIEITDIQREAVCPAAP